MIRNRIGRGPTKQQLKTTLEGMVLAATAPKEICGFLGGLSDEVDNALKVLGDKAFEALIRKRVEE